MDRPEGGKQDTLESRAYEALKTAIITGVYPPGGQVVEELVAKQLEMSRSPVRIAIKRLQAEGFLERYPNKRIYVAMADAQKTVDALYIREALEGMASRLAALYRDDTDVEQLRAAEAALDRCAREGDALRLYQAEIQLHRTVLAACKNTQLERMAANLLDQESVFRYRSMLMDETRGADSLREHKAIVQAVSRRDEEGAERLAREHVHKLLQWVRRTQQSPLSQAASPLRPLSRE